jgi:hypothetical protein
MLRLPAGIYRCDPGWSCKKTSRQYAGNEQRYREYTSDVLAAHVTDLAGALAGQQNARLPEHRYHQTSIGPLC